LNELVDLYNKQMTTSATTIGGQSSIRTDPSHFTPQSTFTMNAGFDSIGDNQNTNFSFTDNVSSALLFDSDTSRFHLNDRVISGDIVRPHPHNPPRIERIKHPDKIVFSSVDVDINDYEHNEEYSTRYPDIKHQLGIITTQQANLPGVDLYTHPGEQVERLAQAGKLKNFHGYINYPYNYIEPPWHFDQSDEQQGLVNHNPPRSYYKGPEVEYGGFDDQQDFELPYGIPQSIVSKDRYEIIPLPKMAYQHFVPLTATRRLVFRRQTAERVHALPSVRQRQNSAAANSMASQLPQIEEMTYHM